MQSQGQLSLSLQRYSVRVLASKCNEELLRASSLAPKLKEMVYSLDLASSVLFRRGNKGMYDITSTYAEELRKAYDVQRSDQIFFRDQLQKMSTYIDTQLQF